VKSRISKPNRVKHQQRVALVLVSLCLLACSTPTPPQAPDISATAGDFLQAGPSSTPALDAATWAGFGDPVLDALIARARAANHDVRIAAQRVNQARAGLSAISSRLIPTLSATGSVSDQRSGLPEDVKRGQPDVRAIRGALDLGWEIDVSGAARAARDGAAFDALAASAGLEVAQWLATTEVARLYLIRQGARVRLQQLQALLEAQRSTARLTRSRLAEGLSSRFDVSRADAEVENVSAQLPALATLIEVSGYQIDVVLGNGPGGAGPGRPEQTWRDTPLTSLPTVPALTPGQPVELLNRRPDLRVAQQQLLAEGARLRESQADLWPKFFIAALLGQQDLRINLRDLSPVRYSNVALAFSAPIFNAGRLRAAIERQSARERIATLQYERTVLSALQDVESSLVALAQERLRGQALTAAVASRATALQHAQSLYREGQIDLLQVLDLQRGLIASQLAHTESQTQQALGAVQLVKALGGGWYADPIAASTSPLTTQRR
jgi:NodT family efflux transporter outer membrane factor (OMF) lipoprotein